MADVFLSYARDDEVIARRVAGGLAGAGLSVFWDPQIRTGNDWRDTLEREIAAARAVVVLWSRVSRKKSWVKEEAQQGADRHCLIQILIDGAKPPLGFGAYQALQLDASTPSRDEELLRSVTSSVSELPTAPRTGSVIGGDSAPFTVSKDASPQRVVLAAVASSPRTSMDVLRATVPLSEGAILKALHDLEASGYVRRYTVPSKGVRFSATERGRSWFTSP